MPGLLGRLLGPGDPRPPGPGAALPEARDAFRRAARELSLRPAIIPPRLRDDLALLYAFCRLVDTVVDEPAPGGDPAADLAQLEAEILGRSPPRPLVQLLLEAGPRIGFDPGLLTHLFEGMRADLGPVRLSDDDALVRYAYQVAGTVSIMTCRALGTRASRAVPFAVDLGIALQITNIVRDWRADAARDRVYLPGARLAAAGISAEDVLSGRAAPRIRPVLEGMNRLAARYYASAESAAGDIPLRYRHGVLVMNRVYQAEGRRAAQGDPRSRPGAVSVPAWERAAIMLRVAGLAFHPRVAGLAPPPVHDRGLHEAILGLTGCEP